MTTTKSITILGLGNMGLALAQTLHAAGVQVTAWNRTTDRPNVKTAVESGVLFEADITTAIAANELILICVLDYHGLTATLQSVLPQLADKKIVNLTNGTPKQARELGALVHQHGVAMYVDGAIMVPPHMVGTPASFLVISGETEAALLSDILRPDVASLDSLGKWMYRGTDVGAAALFDVAALASMYGMFAGSFVMLALLKKQKSDASGTGSAGTEREEEPQLHELTETTLVPFLRELVPYVGLFASTWDRGAWDETYGSAAGMMDIGMKNILEACEDEGVDGGPLRYFGDLVSQVVAEHGEEKGFALVGPALLR